MQDDENDLDELKEHLKSNLHLTKGNKKNDDFRKGRSPSNHSSNSLDPNRDSHRGIWNRVIRKVSPNPSPVGSDADDSHGDSVSQTPRKKTFTQRSFRRKRKPSPAAAKNDVRGDDDFKLRSKSCPDDAEYLDIIVW